MSQHGVLHPTISREEFEELRGEVAALRRGFESVHPTVLEHGVQLDRLAAAYTEVRRELGAIANQVNRLSSVATTQGLSLEKIDRNVQRLLEILEPRTVIVERGK